MARTCFKIRTLALFVFVRKASEERKITRIKIFLFFPIEYESAIKLRFYPCEPLVHC